MNGSSFPLTSSYGLHFREEDGTYICEEIATLRDRLEKPVVDAAIDRLLTEICEFDVTDLSGSFDNASAKRAGRLRLESVLQSIRDRVETRGLTPYDAMLYWCGEWWKEWEEIDTLVFRTQHQHKTFMTVALAGIHNVLSRRSEYGEYELVIGKGRFACMRGRYTEVGRIVFDDTGRLWRFPHMGMYMYLQQQADGLPLARGVWRKCDSKRCFFDGVRFMHLDRFRSCRFNARINRNGYILHADNGTTIVNGKLYTLGHAATEASYIGEDGRLWLHGEPLNGPDGEFRPSDIVFAGGLPEAEAAEYVSSV